jgi:hypothetical protein
MDAPLSISEGPEPREGDIVVTLECDSRPAWSVRRYRGPAQVSAQTRQDAIAVADLVARELAVDVWSLEGEVYGVLARHRRRNGTAQPAKAVRGA